ncbi:sigma-70 family RNA polymerase sigma factor [Hymenobacter sp. 15J16-1T3B]|uniref:sigma-70 family RNA polymerase sigma factor n=1 Tax=Hymenobacter sp. 15J16-1T3B TaxID=2886941 RepID=UPI001D107B53|nr:sigma-70 family RNA polymerase sigma factor [Hymenobacter sp. 15J16-1T3B]MCC3159745.1 sigma-70 family RNA polymerase sigma factor [Hymenobacter sp. 15J16-1T3B]
MSQVATTAEPARWLERYGDELYRFALGRVTDAATAEELVQDTLVSALGALTSFRGQASERTWLFAILKRKVIDHYRRQARSPFIPLDLSPEQAPEAEFFRPADGHWRPEHYPTDWAADEASSRSDAALEQREFQAVLQGCQQRLAPQHLAVFVLRFVEEQPAVLICQELGLSSANYWVIIHRAKLYLRRCLEKNWFRPPAPPHS